MDGPRHLFNALATCLAFSLALFGLWLIPYDTVARNVAVAVWLTGIAAIPLVAMGLNRRRLAHAH